MSEMPIAKYLDESLPDHDIEIGYWTVPSGKTHVYLRCSSDSRSEVVWLSPDRTRALCRDLLEAANSAEREGKR